MVLRHANKRSSKPHAFHTILLFTDDDSWGDLPKKRAGGEGFLSAPYNWQTTLTEMQDLTFSNIPTAHAVCPLSSQRPYLIAAHNTSSHRLKWNQCVVLYSLLGCAFLLLFW